MANTVDIIPITKWKRILVYLGDAAITFLLAIFLFVVAVYPIGTKIVDYTETSQEIQKKNRLCDDLFFANDILFYESDVTKYDYEASLEYTYKKFLSVYVDDASSNNDVFYNYFVTLKSDENKYKSLFKDTYFNVGVTVELKNEYKEPLKPLFNDHDELTEYGSSIYLELQEKGFLMMYSEIVKDVQTNDLTYNGISYKKTCEELESLNQNIHFSISIFAIISFFLSSIICYLLLPLCIGNKTVLMKVMKYEKIGVDNLYLLSKKENLLSFVYNAILSLYTVFFVPLMVIPFVGLFIIPIILPISLVSLLIVIVSFVVLMCSGYNRTLSDVLTKTVLVKAEELDKIYKSKGYIQD